MRTLIQRVTRASVTVDNKIVGGIERGLVVLLGVGGQDGAGDADRLAEKITSLRIFNDEAGKFNHSLLDVGGGALVVSQFTLYADTRRGRRPSFTAAAPPERARPLCDHFADRLKRLGVRPVATGTFGAKMHVEIHNDGPVTVWLDSAQW